MCLSEMRLKATGLVLLVPMPGEVQDSTQGKHDWCNVAYCGVWANSTEGKSREISQDLNGNKWLQFLVSAS